MPYSSPESYFPSGHFDQKNDVFSLGVIAYELLYGHYPFFLSNHATRSQVYRNSDYPNHWFYNPEELLNYGDQHVFPLLQLLIARCLHPDPASRPHLDWLCVTLR
jgi:serine/threonine protein kinase